MENLIIVSNRLPFKIEKKGDKFETRQSSGGLVSAMLSLANRAQNITWVGIADFKEETWKNCKKELKNQVCNIEPLFVNKKDYQLYYNGFSNTVVWPLFHYFPSYAEYEEKFYEAYQAVNREFAKKIVDLAKAGDTIWIHDYHLMLLPRYIKEARRDVNVGFFLHIPFPSYEILKLIPESWRTGIIEGLIHADVVGFHTAEYLSHFKRSLSYFSGLNVLNNKVHFGNNICLIRHYPISIDYKKFNDAFNYKSVVKGRNAIREKHKNSKIIFSVDRLDYTKGVINRLQAYEHLLETHPEMREKIVLVINVVPSRDQITRYAERKKMIEENIGRINGLYGNMQWQPVIYQYRHMSFNQLLSFYTVANVALITPLRDGMNLVAKEFVASRKDKRGILILSEFAGASSELKGALLVNPNDIQTMKNGIVAALALTQDEQVERMEKMQKILQENDIHKWLDDFLNDLVHFKTHSYPREPRVMTFEKKKELFDAYVKTKKRLILLDYDGTLAPFCIRPEDAVPTNALKELLSDLNNQPENEVILISGRDMATLESWFSGTGITLVGEHGNVHLKKSEEQTAKDPVHAWKSEVESILESTAQMFAGSFVEKKKHSLAFHYRTVPAAETEELKAVLNRQLLMLDANNEFNIMQGNMVIEVISSNSGKGSFVAEKIKQVDYDFILAIGDDTTDEDMFMVLRGQHHFTIRVGAVHTHAKCNLMNSEEVLDFLDRLKNLRNDNHQQVQNG